MSNLRLLRPNDLPHLLELSAQAGWNQTAADWERTLHLAAELCFGIEDGGRVVASTTAIPYAQDLAWIGMVLTHQDHRGKGHASRLLDHALGQLRARKIGWAKLDATKEGQPVYQKAGFESECVIERWHRPAGRPAVPAGKPLARYVVDPSFDRAYFGGYRIPLLNVLLKEGDAALVVGYGYAMGRAGAKAAYFGPSVVRTRDAARKLLEWFLAGHAGEEIYWDLFPDNSDAVQLAIDYGFEPARQLTRMSLQLIPGRPSLPRHNSGVFAIAGFEYG